MTRTEKVERRLIDERERALRALRQVEAEERVPQSESAGDVSRYHQHPADAGAEVAEEEKDFMIAALESDRVAAIDEALRALRADPDSFFRCVGCGRSIDAARLELVPWSRLCAACARNGER
jgi:RNA polymerase-binding transcription factor DksA